MAKSAFANISTLSGQFANNLNKSKIFAGLALLVLNVGAKHIDLTLTPAQKEILKLSITKQFVIFMIAWVGSRDILISLIITIGYVILTDVLLNENNNLNLLPQSLKDTIDLNKDGIIQTDEIETAIKTLKKMQEEKNRQSI